MPIPGVALEKLGFLTIGLFEESDPARGHRATLEMIELGERLGFDHAWSPSPSPSIRHLNAGGDDGCGVATDEPNRARDRSHPARPRAVSRRMSALLSWELNSTHT